MKLLLERTIQLLIEVGILRMVIARAVPAAAGLWPLNAQHGASDITGNGNDGAATGTKLAPGPHGDANGSFLFSGNESSYIHIPNNGMLDVRYAFTILAHIYPTGEAGPIFDYAGSNPASLYWALHFWQYSPQTLQMRPVGRNGYFSSDIRAEVLQQNAWNYVGTAYNSATGNASIWNNGELARIKYIGVAEVASRYPVRVAVRSGDRRVFAGRIACLQLYNFAMTQEQIVAAREVCQASTPPMMTSTATRVRVTTVGKQDMTGAIIGGAVAAGVVILVIAVVAFVVYAKRRRPSNGHEERSAPQFEFEETPSDDTQGALLSDDGEYVDPSPSMTTLQQPFSGSVDTSVSMRQSRTSDVYEYIPPSSGHYQELRPAEYQSLQKF